MPANMPQAWKNPHRKATRIPTRAVLIMGHQRSSIKANENAIRPITTTNPAWQLRFRGTIILDQLGVPRVELGTSSLSVTRSNQLSYTPDAAAATPDAAADKSFSFNAPAVSRMPLRLSTTRGDLLRGPGIAPILSAPPAAFAGCKACGWPRSEARRSVPPSGRCRQDACVTGTTG